MDGFENSVWGIETTSREDYLNAPWTVDGAIVEDVALHIASTCEQNLWKLLWLAEKVRNKNVHLGLHGETDSGPSVIYHS